MMFKDAYESYKKKCEKLGIKPSSLEKLFSNEVANKENNHIGIEELSNARKKKNPDISETAKKALQFQENRRRNEQSKKQYKIRKERASVTQRGTQ